MVSQPQHPRPPSGAIAKRLSYPQVSLKRALVALLIAARADAYPIRAHPLPLPHLHKRSDSDALGYGGLAVAVVGVLVAAMGVFQGWKCWENRHSSKKKVRVFRSHCLRWWCADSEYKNRMLKKRPQSPPTSSTESPSTPPRPPDRVFLIVKLGLPPSPPPPPAWPHSPLELLPPPPTRSSTLPIATIARPSATLSPVSISRTAFG